MIVVDDKTINLSIGTGFLRRNISKCKSTLNFTPPAPVDALVAQHPAEVELPEELLLLLVQSLQLQHEVVAGVAEVAVQRRGRPVPVRHPCSKLGGLFENGTKY